MFSNLFSKSSFGLYISSESIKYIELVRYKNIFKVGRYGELLVPIDVIGDDEIKNSKQIEKLLTSLRKDKGVKSVHLALSPEEMKNKKGYVSIFKKVKIKIKSLESEVEASLRSLVKENDRDINMVVDFGKKRTLISVVSGGVVHFIFISRASGEGLISSIKQKFGVSLEEAEKIKQRNGLKRNIENQGVFNTLLRGVSILREDIEKHFLYWHTHKNKHGMKNLPIKKIILSGEEASLLGLSEYLSVSLRNKVEMGNVWTNVFEIEKNIPEINFNQSLGFAAAIGVALKDF